MAEDFELLSMGIGWAERRTAVTDMGVTAEAKCISSIDLGERRDSRRLGRCGGPLKFVRTCHFARERKKFRHAPGAGLRFCSLLEMLHWYFPCISRDASAERARVPPFSSDSTLLRF